MKDFNKNYYKVDKKGLGLNLVNLKGEILPHKIRKKLGIKFYRNKEKQYEHPKFTFDINGKESQKCNELNFYSENQAMIFSDNFTYYNINLKSGIISPEFSDYSDNIFLATNGTIYQLDENGNTIDTGYKMASFQPNKNRYRFNESNFNSDLIKVSDKNGKFGLIDKNLNKVCPFIYDNNNFTYQLIDKKNNLLQITDKTNNIIQIFKDSKEIFKTEIDNQSKFEKLDNNYYLHNSKNISKLFKYNVENTSFNFAGNYNGNIINLYNIGNEDYINIENKKLIKLDNNSIVVDGCLNIKFEKIDGEPVIAYELNNSNQKNIMGVFSPKENRIVLSPIHNIYDVQFNQSAKMPDGSYRFLGRALDEDDNNKFNWGVIDDKGNKLTEFKYHFDTNLIKTFYRYNNKGVVSETLISTIDSGDKFFNIKEDNIIATEEEEKAINIPKTQNKTKDNDGIIKDTSNNKLLYSALASVLLSPAAGMYVYMAMDELENEM